MHRACCCVIALTFVGLPCRAEEAAPPVEKLIRLNVPPARIPKPALRYVLLPELKEMNPGNPIQNYFRCFMEQQKFFFDKENFQRREKLLSMPIKELPARELQDYGGFALTQADWAARLDNADWQILLKLKTDGIRLLLPDLQELRSLANPLKIRFRAELALGRFDDAIRTAKTMFAISRHAAEHPSLIADLVGIAVANVAIGPLEELLGQTDSPNLYWALTSLPTPLVPIDLGMDGERTSVFSEFRGLDEQAPMTVDQLKKFIAHWDSVLSDGKPSKPGEGIRAWLDPRIKDELLVAAARDRLHEIGMPKDRLLRLPADQVLLLDEKREYDARFQDLMKTLHLPAWQVESRTAPGTSTREKTLFADVLTEGVAAVRFKQTLLDQRIALLRHVEALRLYAAEHDGQLPAKLSQLSLPLPDDPFTGKPFRYEVQSQTAHLRGSPPSKFEKDTIFNVHYEITIRKP